MRYFVLLFALLSFIAPARAMDCASLARVRTDVLRWDFPVSVTPMDAKASVRHTTSRLKSAVFYVRSTQGLI